MDSVTINLTDRLEHASKKFSKACDQIKLLKQRIAELIKMFSYTEDTNSFDRSDQTLLSRSNFNKNLFNETIRQQIENLQSIKTAYFMYAHKKADEITKLQCELYGEDAVREAYEMATTGNELNENVVNETNSIDDYVSDVESSVESDDDDAEYTIQWELETEDNLTRRSSINNDHDYLIA